MTTNAAPSPTIITETICNTGYLLPTTYEMFVDGVLFATSPPLAQGECFTFPTYTDSAGASHTSTVRARKYTGSLFQIEPNQYVTVYTGSNSPPPWLDSPPLQTNTIPTNPIVKFSQPTNLNQVLVDGFTGLANQNSQLERQQLALLDEMNKTLGRLPTNSVVNVSNSVNVNITNLNNFTNDFGPLTNFLKAHFQTNFPGADTNAIQAGIAEATNGFAGAFAPITGLMDGLRGINYQFPDSATAEPLLGQIPGVGTFNLNPFAYGPISAVAGWLRAFIGLIVFIKICQRAFKDLMDFVGSLGQVQPAQASGQQILGTNLNFFAGKGAAIMITVVIAGAIIAAFGLLGAAISGDPVLQGITGAFSTAGSVFSGYAAPSGAASTAMAWANSVVPIGFILGTMIGLVVFRAGMVPILALACVAVKYATICILAGFILSGVTGFASAQTNAWNSTNVVIDGVDYNYTETGSVWGACFWGFASAFGLGAGCSAIRYLRQGIDV
jgi:hypothetical protein